MNETNEFLAELRALIYEVKPETASDWLPLMEFAGDDPVALDYIRGYGCKYKSLATCQAAITRSRRNKFRKDPVAHLTPETFEEYREIGFMIVWGIHPHKTGGGWTPALYYLGTQEGFPFDCLAQLAWHSEKRLTHEGARKEAVQMANGKAPIWIGLRDQDSLEDI